MRELKIKFYWMIMNITEYIFDWARERWTEENHYVYYRPTLYQQKHLKPIESIKKGS